MTDDEILDADIRTFDNAYVSWVAHRRRLQDAIIPQWFARSQGHAIDEGNVGHALWRGANEYARWGTWRAALAEMWPIGDAPQPEPATDGAVTIAPAGAIHPSLIGRVIQVTHSGDVINRGYSYWAQTVVDGSGNAWSFAAGPDGVWLYMTPLRGAAAYPSKMTKLGDGTGEGWYWDRDGRLLKTNGPRLVRNVATLFDISTDPRFAGCDLWQAHSSDDGTVHSATVRRVVSDGAYPKIGTVALCGGVLRYFEARGALDESQVDASGMFLVIKEDDDNRIVDLSSGHERVITNADGALGHSDCGWGFAVGENDQAGTCDIVNLRNLERVPLFPANWNMGHVAVRTDLVLQSDTVALILRNMHGDVIRTTQHGMTGSGYDYQVHANLSPCGRVATFASNKDGGMNLFLWILA